MESYSEILSALEEKIQKAEEEKLQAEKERDEAINNVKVIRQRYISIIGNDKTFE
jgi:hypothetical protein